MQEDQEETLQVLKQRRQVKETKDQKMSSKGLTEEEREQELLPDREIKHPWTEVRRTRTSKERCKRKERVF